jgi:DNA-binding transcriptional LysR family regulator
MRSAYTDEVVALFDAAACATTAPITLDALCRLPHLMMSTRGDTAGLLDRALAEVGRARRILLVAPYFLALPFLLHGLAAVACVPRALGEACAGIAGLTVSPLPVSLPRTEIRMAWTERSDRDPGLVWLRDQIVAAVGRL